MHLDSPLYHSYYRYAVWGGFLLLVIILAVACHLVWWQYLLAVAVFALLSYGELIKPDLLHLVSDDDEWQFLVRTGLGDELWRGKVKQMTDFGFCVAIKADIHFPNPQIAHWVIYGDMLEMDDYRKLKAIAKFRP